MITSRRLTPTLLTLATALATAPAFADHFTFPTTLSGYNETPSTLNSTGSGEFLAKVSKDEQSIAYTLTYRNLGTAVIQAHIHFGRPGLNGGVVLFLCNTSGTPPATVPVPPQCPQSAGTVSGVLTAADVIAVAGQGIDAGAAGFAEMVKALRNGAAYANVHTTQRPGGEIRGPLGKVSDDDENDDD
jgi:CHRD domain-containing protein